MITVSDAAVEAFRAAERQVLTDVAERAWRDSVPIDTPTRPLAATRAGLEAAAPLLAAEALERAAEEEMDARWHRAVLRRHMAEHGLEDPTWAGLSEQEKAVLRDGDAKVLAESPRRLPTGRDAA